MARAWSRRGAAIDPASVRTLTAHRGAVLGISIDPGADTVDVLWRDQHAEHVGLTPPHAVRPWAVRADESAQRRVVGAPPQVIAPRGSELLVRSQAARTIDDLRRAIADTTHATRETLR